MSGFQTPAAPTISGAFVVGVLLVFLGSARFSLAKRLGLAESKADWLSSALSLALIPGMLAAGTIVGHFEAKTALLLGSLLATVAVLALAFSETFGRALGSILLMGIGCAFLSTGASVLMLPAFFPENELASQNLGNVFFGLGALATPILFNLLEQRIGFRRAFSAIAFVALLPALFTAFTARDAFAGPANQTAGFAEVLRNPIFWLVSLAFLLYGPLEGSLGSWATRYLGGMGFREHVTSWLLAGFWLAFLGARLAAALMATTLEQHGSLPQGPRTAWFILIFALAGAVAIGNMAGAPRRSSAAIGLLLVGAFLGPIFPTLVTILFAALPHARGPAFGAMFAIGATGNLLIPPAIAIYARRKSLQAAMRIPMITALVLALVALILALFPLIG
jgi:fucose permease